MSHKHLVDEIPLLVFPSLAEKVGLNESILLQKLHGWLCYYDEHPEQERDRHWKDGRWWVWDTYEDWQEMVPWISASTIKRALTNLSDMGIVLKGNYNRMPMDRTNWYTIDYNAYDALWEEPHEVTETPPLGHDDPMDEVMVTRAVPISSLSDHASSRAKARPTTNESKATTLPVFEWEMSDDDIHVIECPQCESQLDVWTELPVSAAQCPHCGLPLQIKNSHGKVTHRPPQAARHRTRTSPWLVAVEAFCERAGLEWAKVSGRQKGQWAKEIAEVVGEGADPGEVAAAIKGMEVHDVSNLTSPYQKRFKEPLVIALARGEGSDLETVPLPELRARLAGGELRMDDLDAGEQAVVLARLGALP